jgi:hypothetical protein
MHDSPAAKTAIATPTFVSLAVDMALNVPRRVPGPRVYVACRGQYRIFERGPVDCPTVLRAGLLQHRD